MKDGVLQGVLGALKRADLADEQWVWLEIVDDSHWLLWKAGRSIEELPKGIDVFGKLMASMLVATISITGNEVTLTRAK